jgi:anti-anti-sigma factor
MDVCNEMIGEVCVCRVSGKLDAEAEETLRRMLTEVGQSTPGPVLLNLEGVELIGSACLGVLVNFRRGAMKDRRAALCCISPILSNMLRFAALDQLFETADAEADAIKLLESDAVH